MTDAQVIAWLRCAGLSRFAPRFGAACVSQNNFLELSSTDLDALGVDGPADRKRLHDLISDLRRSADMPPRRATPPRSATHHTLHPVGARPVLETLSQTNSSLSTNSTTTNMPLSKSTIARPARRTSKVAPSSTDSPPSITTPPVAREPSQPIRTLSAARVTVCVRKRPLSRKELTANNHDIVVVNQSESSLYVHELKEKVDLTKYVETHPFTFDRVFGENVGNPGVYEGTARPLVDALFSGGRSTCFAYGQTGAGKTFTMAGDGLENPGLFTLAVRDLFDRIRRIESEQWRAAEAEGNEDFVPPDPPQVWISFFEIYASKLQDLLNRSGKLECREDSNNEVQIVGLTERLCEVEEDVLACIDEGSAARATGVTGANDDSSRSHAVFQIELAHPPSLNEQKNVNIAMKRSLLHGSQASAPYKVKKGAEIGKLCFIDLAGSERGIDTASSNRQTRMEGAEINKSLLALKECIRAMDQRKDHTPFRGSKLTQVLKASFMGKNCRTVMIANISPASSNVEHTLNTLRYSDRVKEIKKNGKQNTGYDSGKSFGGRRATFSHGVGMRGRQSTIISIPTANGHGSDSESMDLSPTEPPVSERKPPKTCSDPPIAAEDTLLSSQNLSRGLSRRRATSKFRARPSDVSAMFPTTTHVASDQAEVSKPQEARPLRRRPSRTASQLPSRPSLGASMLPKPSLKSKPSGDGKVTRSNSGLKRPTPPVSTAVSDSETMQDYHTEEDRADVRRDDAKKVAHGRTSGMITRRRAKELEAQAREKAEAAVKLRTRSESPSGRRPPKGCNATRRKEALLSLSKPANTNDAPAGEDELSEEDILYDSSDDLVSAVTAATEMTGSMYDENDAMVPEKMETDIEPRRRSSAEKHVRRLSSSRVAPRSFSYAGSPSRRHPGENQSSVTREIDVKLRNVIRLHHAQIEELMRLTEADVALINAAEKGELDPQDYALKLSVNLSQKIDIVRTLQAKAKMLE